MPIRPVRIPCWLSGYPPFPPPTAPEMAALYAEMDALETDEARLYKALDKLEAVIQHNEAPISTWLPREYALNLTYADENVAFSPTSPPCGSGPR